MKKFIAILLICLALATSVFASTNFSDSPQGDAWMRTSAKMQGMGGAGVALKTLSDALYINPASLAEDGLLLNIPSVALTVYNFADLITSNTVQDLFGGTSLDLGDALNLILDTYAGKGCGQIAKVDLGIGFKAGHVGFAVDTQVSIPSFQDDGNTTSLQLYPKIDMLASLGFGLRFFEDSSVNMDIGAAIRFQMRTYYSDINVDSILNQVTSTPNIDPFSLLGPVSLGWALPLDFGLNLNLPFGITTSVVLRNVNGTFRYTDYLSGTTAMLDDYNPFGNREVASPMQLDFGFAFNPDMGNVEKYFDFGVAVDFVDLIDLFGNNFTSSKLLENLKVGAEIELIRFIEARVGMNQGFLTLGAGVNLFKVIHVEAAYYTNEFGLSLGERPIDALTVRVNIAWE